MTDQLALLQRLNRLAIDPDLQNLLEDMILILPDGSVTETEAMQGGRWVNADDIDRMVREMDVALNGSGAARKAKLFDLVSQVKSLAGARSAGVVGCSEVLSEPNHYLRSQLVASIYKTALEAIAAGDDRAKVFSDPHYAAAFQHGWRAASEIASQALASAAQESAT